jgi:hypothetical protein
MNLKEQGLNASDLFVGHSSSKPTELLYKESSSLFAELIKSREFVPEKEYVLADLGSHRGDFLKEVLSLMPEYHFKTLAIDINADDLEQNIADEKMVSDLNVLKLENKSIDITFARYVLAWNNLEKQKEILLEIKRITKGLAIIQHQGAKESGGEILQAASKVLFSGAVPELKREDFFFSTVSQIEEALNKLDISYEKVQDRNVEGLSALLIEKYSLSEDNANLVKDILKECDYVTQVCWVLTFN